MAKDDLFKIALYPLAIVVFWIALTKDVPTWGAIGMLVSIIYAIISRIVDIKNYMRVDMRDFIMRGIRGKRNLKERLYIGSIFTLFALLGVAVYGMVEAFSD